jgi:hypothetical protein
MAMFLVIPAKKSLQKRTAVLDATAAFWELRPIFHGFKLALRKGIIVGDVGTIMGFGYPQVGQ